MVIHIPQMLQWENKIKLTTLQLHSLKMISLEVSFASRRSLKVGISQIISFGMEPILLFLTMSLHQKSLDIFMIHLQDSVMLTIVMKSQTQTMGVRYFITRLVLHRDRIINLS